MTGSVAFCLLKSPRCLLHSRGKRQWLAVVLLQAQIQPFDLHDLRIRNAWLNVEQGLCKLVYFVPAGKSRRISGRRLVLICLKRREHTTHKPLRVGLRMWRDWCPQFAVTPVKWSNNPIRILIADSRNLNLNC